MRCGCSTRACRKDIRDALQPHIESGAVRLVPVASDQQPNEWRAAIVPRLSSPYAVFIDNDVVVRAGWLEKLIACAEETGRRDYLPVVSVGRLRGL